MHIFKISTEFDPDHLQDLGYISAKIRETLVAARRPEFIASYISVAGHLMMLAADKKEQFFFGSDPTMFWMNSTVMYVLRFSQRQPFLCFLAGSIGKRSTLDLLLRDFSLLELDGSI